MNKKLLFGSLFWLSVILLFFIGCSGEHDYKTLGTKHTIVYNVYFSNTVVREYTYSFIGNYDDAFCVGSHHGTNYIYEGGIMSDQSRVFSSTAPIEVVSITKEKIQ